jgi:hypothetical protein
MPTRFIRRRYDDPGRKQSRSTLSTELALHRVSKGAENLGSAMRCRSPVRTRKRSAIYRAVLPITEI